MTYIILGVPCDSYSIISPKTQFELFRFLGVPGLQPFQEGLPSLLGFRIFAGVGFLHGVSRVVSLKFLKG